ncbi:MAG: 5-formyltetrahydrofolate cyclo-ligase [Acetivibrionales bacterium]|jgi:5-formyltetrahydrofolate cyclo-ligase|nr:5-formyltetrahydrofolate cyclo-ligase [Clostridiaceae bacterium]
MEKNQLRKEISKKRNQLNENAAKNASETIVRTLESLPDLLQAKVIFSYMPYGKEVDIKPLNQWILDQGKVLCLPRVINSVEMEAREINSINNEGLFESSFGILEPTTENKLVDIDKIDSIIVPGLAFDKTGNRMGHGRGYYDRFLSRCPATTIFIGVAYSFQVFNSIPFDNYDVKVHKVITEEYTINLIKK